MVGSGATRDDAISALPIERIFMNRPILLASPAPAPGTSGGSGGPGPRGGDGDRAVHAACFRDLDGNGPGASRIGPDAA